MKLGVFLPVSGRAAVPEVLIEAARQAERLGYDSVWAAERLVNPWAMTTRYPYSASQQWFVPPDSPFLEPLTCLSFLAACTEKVSLGMSVAVLPYRHPLYTARVATSIDTLSKGRLILGVGIGWMVEEFEALGVPFKARAGMSNEQLEIFNLLWKEERPRFQGRYYRFNEVAVSPKPVQKPRFPIWIGGESEAAQRRAAKYADAWFSYFVKITPQELAARFANVRKWTAEAGRDPAEVHLCCCRPIEVTREPVPQEEDSLRGTPEQLVEALKRHQEIGVEHIALQFMVGRWPERKEQIERFGRDVIPALRK
ncbi:MAG: TIGR03619 family F420-dependent LLM class oxidoreductase [Deltaproteobacteria bacterium]|nr:TIGR03619 family F420-dependent LLM class oxidoreductase [Deltaproteobacteria bacterium]